MSARALVRISNYMSKEKLRIFMNVFLSSQFRYCALVRILHSLTLYNRIDQLQERVLRLIYDDNDFPFRSISKTNNSPSRYPEIYYWNWPGWGCAWWCFHKEMSELFSQVNFSCNVHKDKKFCSYNLKVVLYGTKTL